MDEVGTGPGAITNDGCAVEFYALLPTFGEPEIVHAAVPQGASILELGCGTGRILRPLAAMRHPVTGVDDSRDMLARSPDLPTVCSPIQSLRLDRAFDVVLLASTMINTDPATRRGFLATVRHHLCDDGVAVFQQNPPDWFETLSRAEPVRGRSRRHPARHPLGTMGTPPLAHQDRVQGRRQHLDPRLD